MIAPEYKAEAVRDAAAARDMGPVRGFGKSGRQTMRIPVDAFHRAIQNNGGVDKNGKHCWNDKEFVADMQRHHPHIVCEQEGRIHVGGSGDGSGRPRNRHGRIKERFVYGPNGQRAHINYDEADTTADT